MPYHFITVGGSVSTGSTPLIDMLREYDETKVVNGEFRPGKYIFQIAADLLLGNQINMSKFKSYKELTLHYGRDNPRLFKLIFSLLIRIPKNAREILPYKVQYLHRNNRKFRGYEKRIPAFSKITERLFDDLEEINHHVHSMDIRERINKLNIIMERFFLSVCDSFVRDNPDKTPVFDQMINPNKLFSEPGEPVLAKLLSSAAIIVVSRDVRDQYCDMIRKGKKEYHLMDPKERVNRYITEYKKRYSDMQKKLKELPENILHVQFEDLIFNYNNKKKEIEKFLGIKSHIKPRQYFDPEKAAKNTCIFRHHDELDEIKLIERNMEKWLYDFEYMNEL